MHSLPLHPCFTPAHSGASSRCRRYPSAGGRISRTVVSATASSRWSLPKTEYDLYELLGIDSSADSSRVRAAYRVLQKRCHPDIAGPVGHDMAIVLNEAYAILSDPILRAAYDKARRASSNFVGYTGEPLYSSWRGDADGTKAVFVDEVRCVGCLKCALLAGRTFAIEAAHGRARVVAQWADPEDDVLDAIKACPVDCISIVPRSELPALEFLMSKLPRERVRIGASPTAGKRVPDVFKEAEIFRRKYGEMQDKKASSSKEYNQQAQARARTAQGIMAMAEWLMYWKPSSSTASARQASRPRLLLTAASTAPAGQRQSGSRQEDLKRVLEAAGRRRRADEGSRRTQQSGETFPMCYAEEYWKPPVMISSPSSQSPPSSPPPTKTKYRSRADISKGTERKRNKSETGAPTYVLPIQAHAVLLAAAVAAASFAYGGGDSTEVVGGGLQEHVGGSLALEMVNSSEMRILLAAFTWYLCATTVTGVVGLLTGVTRGNVPRDKSKK